MMISWGHTVRFQVTLSLKEKMLNRPSFAEIMCVGFNKEAIWQPGNKHFIFTRTIVYIYKQDYILFIQLSSLKFFYLFITNRA